MSPEIFLSSANTEKIRVLNKLWNGKAEIKTPDTLGLKIPDDLESNGTYEGNSFNKAEWLFKQTGPVTIADDSGMEISGLQGKPGAFTRRWAGFELDDDALIVQTIDRIKNLSESDRVCDFVICATAIIDARKKISIFEKDSGILLLNPRGERIPGHPLASLLWIPDKKQTLAELNQKSEFESKDVRAHKKLQSEILQFYIK